ncbi:MULTISPECIES: hypothetical protein [Methylobacterium]|uniref:hypothetical protein n=1 Tax=Methylobacterium TaxID=407 RepID=UPI0012E80B7D|nr:MULTISPECIES: hypothetical protein [Methylobacterium]MCI9882179.1 hypothetical protein [Methylobacterium goesingense]
MMLLPEWTERTAKRGLDPLGLQNSGVQLYQTLVPGISNVTLRVRYYGLYCWASEAYAQEVRSTSVDEWRDWIRRLEALHALVAAHVGGQVGVAGIEWAQRRLALDDFEDVDFTEGASLDRDCDIYLRQSFGVFGQAYLSQLIELGLFEVPQHHLIPVRTAAGLVVAKAFGASIGEQLGQALVDAIKIAKVTRTQLAQMKPILPSEIQAGNERDAYEAVLFGTDVEATVSTQRRRDTLMLVLHSARETSKRPNSTIVRQRLFKADQPVPVSLEVQRLRWETYHAQDLWQSAAGALLSWSISIIEEFDDGRSLPEIHAEVAARLRDRSAETSKLIWREYRGSVDLDDSAFNERMRRLLSNQELREDRALVGIEQLAALDERCRLRPDLESEIVRSFALGGGGRSIRSELQWIRKNENRSLDQVVPDMVAERIISRHTWVATQKLRRQRDYTFLFESREGRYAFRSQSDPVLTTPRLDPAIQFLVDIKLIGVEGCTGAGLAIIEQVH